MKHRVWNYDKNAMTVKMKNDIPLKGDTEGMK